MANEVLARLSAQLGVPPGGKARVVRSASQIATPRAMPNIPNVATNGGNFNFVMSKPFASPQIPPIATPVATATRLVCGVWPHCS